jgi:hypothetical protein
MGKVGKDAKRGDDDLWIHKSTTETLLIFERWIVDYRFV